MSDNNKEMNRKLAKIKIKLLQIYEITRAVNSKSIISKKNGTNTKWWKTDFDVKEGVVYRYGKKPSSHRSRIVFLFQLFVHVFISVYLGLFCCLSWSLLLFALLFTIFIRCYHEPIIILITQQTSKNKNKPEP